ncbi:MAG: hypothetical protein GWO02_12800 [Gammaproteobacteria bacterium]|nr:hypothetical protein [Gammaproteobacteria bacterium]
MRLNADRIVPALLAGAFLITAQGAPAPAQADTPRYRVEIVVFARPDGARATNERWPRDSGRPAPEKAVGLPPETGVAGEAGTVRRVRADHLSRAVEDLADARGYRPILHTAWVQPTGELREARGVRIESRREVEAPEPGPAPDAPPEQAPLFADGMFFGETARAAPPRRVPEAQGTVIFAKGRYLHIKLDLLYHTELPQPAHALETETRPAAFGPDDERPGPTYEVTPSPTTAMQAVRLTQHRRVRTGELHYFDHPLFGALVRVTEAQ